jgi:chromosome partitioning protein
LTFGSSVKGLPWVRLFAHVVGRGSPEGKACFHRSARREKGEGGKALAGRVIAFVNFKGGVGKTANVVNIGACLAKYHGKKVLIVDLDAQCNSSLWLMKPEELEKHNKDLNRCVYQIFRDKIVGSSVFDFARAVVRGVPRREYTLIANLDLLPSAVEMAKIEDQIHQIKSVSAFTVFYQALKPYFDGYDYVFLDCPPNLYTVSKNALFAAEYCVVPYIPDYLSLSGFGILADMIEDFYTRRRPQISAFIINHFARQRNVFETGVNEFEIMVNRLKANGKIHPKAQCLHPYIRFNVHVAESTNEHLPVILHKEDSIGAMDYADLTQNFIHHFEDTL